MLPAGAFAIILLLNGLQITMPGPAYVHQGRVWAPVRPVLQGAGYKVVYTAATRQVVVSRANQRLALDLRPEPNPPPPGPRGPYYAIRRGGQVYFPLGFVRLLDLTLRYQPTRRLAEVGTAPQAPQDASLAAILTDPLSWTGRPVRLTGEYLGWSPYPFCYATDTTNLTPGDFVLRNESGALYCHMVPPPQPGPATLGLAEGARPPLTPYESLGRRLAVEGVVELARDGRPRLACWRVTSLTGLAGLTCLLRLDRPTYYPGQEALGQVVVANPFKEALAVPAEPRGYALTIADPGGGMTLAKLSLAQLTYAGGKLIIPPGQRLTLPVAWPVPDRASLGAHQIVVHLGEGLDSYPVTFHVIARPEARPVPAAVVTTP